MPSNIVELFGYAPDDRSPGAIRARHEKECPFVNAKCTKTLSSREISGVCTLKPKTSGPVICCPNRLYAKKHQILQDITKIAFGHEMPLLPASSVTERTGECIAVFGRSWGKELRLPTRGKSGGYFVDWVLARIANDGSLAEFVAVEVQSIDTTGNYQAERSAYMREKPFPGASTAGFNWENVNKRILPQIIYKGHVLRQEPLCRSGLFFVCPSPVYSKIMERLGGELRPYPIQPGALTIMWYDLGPSAPSGALRDLVKSGHLTTTIDQVALAFTAPRNLPPPQVYENAIRSELRIK